MRDSFCLVLVLLALWPLQAHAYFDPGSGAVLLQLLVAAGISVLFRFRAWLAKVIRQMVAFFRR